MLTEPLFCKQWLFTNCFVCHIPLKLAFSAFSLSAVIHFGVKCKAVEFIAAAAVHSTTFLTPTASLTLRSMRIVIPCPTWQLFYFLHFMILHVECHAFPTSDLNVLSYLSLKLWSSDDAAFSKAVFEDYWKWSGRFPTRYYIKDPCCTLYYS